MSFGERIKFRRGELHLSRAELAGRLGVTPSAISNYENGLSFPKEDVILRLFDCLETEPNTLFRDSFQSRSQPAAAPEQGFLRKYRELSRRGREVVESLVDALSACREEAGAQRPTRKIFLYRTLSAVGEVSPVIGKDVEELAVTDEVPPTAEFAVCICGNDFLPHVGEGEVVYVERAPLREGDVGLFSLEGAIFCKQYFKGPDGALRLVSPGKNEEQVLSPPDSRRLVCLGRVILPTETGT